MHDTPLLKGPPGIAADGSHVQHVGTMLSIFNGIQSQRSPLSRPGQRMGVEVQETRVFAAPVPASLAYTTPRPAATAPTSTRAPSCHL